MTRRHLTSSLEGLGAVWGNRAHAEAIPRHIHAGRSIVHFEMYNVSVAIAHWGRDWINRCVGIHSDNMAVVQVLNSMRTNDEFLGVCIRNILTQAAKYNIHICAEHIPGEDNKTADALSRLITGAGQFQWVRKCVHLEPVQEVANNVDFSL